MLNPAHQIIEKCGGVDRVAAMTGRHKSRVARWMWAKSRGGTGGLIPAQVQIELLEAARREGIDLTPEDFFNRSAVENSDEDAA